MTAPPMAAPVPEPGPIPLPRHHQRRTHLRGTCTGRDDQAEGVDGAADRNARVPEMQAEDGGEGMKVTVKTKGANYVVDRDQNRWMRRSESHPRPNDGEWIDGGFTLGEVGQSCFAHYSSHPDGALGRQTSRVISIEEESN